MSFKNEQIKNINRYTEEYYSVLQTKVILSLLTIWIKLELLSEISQRERQILHGITSKWNLKMGKHFELRNREEKNVFQGLWARGNREILAKG